MGKLEDIEGLFALLKIPGALKIITAQRNPEAGKRADLRLPSSFICHDVVEIVPAGEGRYAALSAEGDWTLGYPGALLQRLRQWRSI